MGLLGCLRQRHRCPAPCPARYEAPPRDGVAPGRSIPRNGQPGAHAFAPGAGARIVAFSRYVSARTPRGRHGALPRLDRPAGRRRGRTAAGASNTGDIHGHYVRAQAAHPAHRRRGGRCRPRAGRRGRSPPPRSQGQTVYSGPASSYSVIGKAEDAYFRKVNDERRRRRPQAAAAVARRCLQPAQDGRADPAAWWSARRWR